MRIFDVGVATVVIFGTGVRDFRGEAIGAERCCRVCAQNAGAVITKFRDDISVSSNAAKTYIRR